MYVVKSFREFKNQSLKWRIVKFESSAFAFVCFEISTLLKLEISSFMRVENFKLQKGWNQTQKQMIQTYVSVQKLFLPLSVFLDMYLKLFANYQLSASDLKSFSLTISSQIRSEQFLKQNTDHHTCRSFVESKKYFHIMI